MIWAWSSSSSARRRFSCSLVTWAISSWSLSIISLTSSPSSRTSAPCSICVRTSRSPSVTCRVTREISSIGLVMDRGITAEEMIVMISRIRVPMPVIPTKVILNLRSCPTCCCIWRISLKIYSLKVSWIREVTICTSFSQIIIFSSYLLPVSRFRVMLSI